MDLFVELLNFRVIISSLAAYDLAAPAKVLQAIYDEEAKILSPINLVDRKERIVQDLDITMTRANWTEFVGPEKYIGSSYW